MTTIQQLNREFGVTVVLITHHMDEAARADRLIVMDRRSGHRRRDAQDGLSQCGGSAAVWALTVPETVESAL